MNLNTGGVLHVTNDITIGGGDANGGNSGFIYIDGGTLSVGGAITATAFRLGNEVATAGSHTLAPAQTLTVTTTLIVGNNGFGTLALNDAASTAVVGNGVWVGNNGTSSGRA